MSRLKNFSRNLATSYLQLGVNVVYSLVSVPLILHWLPRAEFGLWAVLVQLMTYFFLVDLGVNQAIARFLVDHKDRRGEGEYGALIRISALVSAIQGLVVLTLVTLGSPLLARLMKVPAEYQATFISLLRMQGVIAAFTFCMNPLQIMLNAHQRMDLVARQTIYNLVAQLGLMLLFLTRGCGIYAFIYAGAITAVITPGQLFWPAAGICAPGRGVGPNVMATIQGGFSLRQGCLPDECGNPIDLRQPNHRRFSRLGIGCRRHVVSGHQSVYAGEAAHVPAYQCSLGRSL